MISSIFSFFVFVFGLIIGSFLNCAIYRLEVGEGPFGRSYCPKCKRVLCWHDLIPVLSFIILKGKCRYCQKPISLQYPLVEFATGILFILIFWHLNFAANLGEPRLRGGFDLAFEFWILDLIYYLLISCFLIIIFVYDFKHYIIPDKALYPAIIITFIYKLVGIWNLGLGWNLEFGHWDFIFAAFLTSLFFLAIVLISRGAWMGMGDVKFAVFMGLFLGFPKTLAALFIAFFIGAIIGVGLILAKKKGLKSEIPFGPFLVFGTLAALFWGDSLLNWYLSLFL